jgi:hypothetical protein
VPFLLRLLPKQPPEAPYVVWLDNLFSSTKLFEYLRKEGIGATGTARANSGIYTEFVQKKKLDKAKDLEPWGTLYSAPTIGNDIMQFAWKDNALVLFLSTTSSDEISMVIRNRKRPSTTSTSAKTARKPFGSEPRKDLPIPKFVDDYNHLMNQVDVGDQLRSTNPGNRRNKRGGWHALWNFLFHVTIVNSYLLSGYELASKFRVDLQDQGGRRCSAVQCTEMLNRFSAVQGAALHALHCTDSEPVAPVQFTCFNQR